MTNRQKRSGDEDEKKKRKNCIERQTYRLTYGPLQRQTEKDEIVGKLKIK